MRPYYIKIEEDGIISFKEVKYEDMSIRGRTFEEINTILSALDFEKETNIKITMENISKIINLYQEEQNKIQQDFINSYIERRGE